MAIKTLLQQDAELLHKQANAVIEINSKEVIKAIKDLSDTMRAQDLVGIAAPQIGYDQQLFVTEVRTTKARAQNFTDKLRIFINPKLISSSKKTAVIYEGCGSYSDTEYFGPVRRSCEITVEALDSKGKKFHLQCDGLLARVILHELDHLAGHLFPDHIQDPKKMINKQKYLEEIKNLPKYIQAQKVTVKKFNYLDH